MFSWCFLVRTFFTRAGMPMGPAGSAKSLTGSLICLCLSDTCWKLFLRKQILKYVFIMFKLYLESYRNSYSKGSRARWSSTWLWAPVTVGNLKWQLENVPMTAALMLWGKTRRLALGPLCSPIRTSSARYCGQSLWTFQRRIKFKEIKSSRCQSQGESSSALKGLSSKSWIICFELLHCYQTDCGGVFEEESDLFVQKHWRGYSSPEAPWEKSDGWQAEAAGDGFDWQLSAIFGIVFTFV